MRRHLAATVRKILSKTLGRFYEAEIAREKAKSHAEGCLEGYKRSEQNTLELIAICRRETTKKVRKDMMSEMLHREDAAYAEGLNHKPLISDTPKCRL